MVKLICWLRKRITFESRIFTDTLKTVQQLNKNVLQHLNAGRYIRMVLLKASNISENSRDNPLVYYQINR